MTEIISFVIAVFAIEFIIFLVYSKYMIDSHFKKYTSKIIDNLLEIDEDVKNKIMNVNKSLNEIEKDIDNLIK